jgi:DNA-binding response OmpR family regulator
MIVDDSKLARMSIGRLLDILRPDWIRIEAANAEQAVALQARETIGAALLDFNMPGRDGLTLAAELRAADAALPIAITTANIQDVVVARATEIGATFLAKPVTQVALAAFLMTIDPRLSPSGDPSGDSSG